MIDWILRLAPRERALLAALVFAVLPAAVALGLLLPLHERRVAAMRAEAEAQALFGWVAARVDERQALEAVPLRPTAAPIGSSGIERALIAADLRRAVSELGLRAGGVIELRFDDVSFTDLANWLSAQAPVWGYAIDSFRFDALEAPARVSAALVLTPLG